MLKTNDMLLRLIKLKEDTGQMDNVYAEYLLSLMDLYVAVERITVEEYQEIYVKLCSIMEPQEAVEPLLK